MGSSVAAPPIKPNMDMDNIFSLHMHHTWTTNNTKCLASLSHMLSVLKYQRYNTDNHTRFWYNT